MILLYTLLMLLLNTFKTLVSLRSRALERKFVRIAAAVDQLARDAANKPGNGKFDPCLSAKKTLVLGQLVQDRDCVEAKYFAWQRWADRWANWARKVRDWTGKKLPYTLGAVDVWMLLSLIDYLGVGQYVSTMALIDVLKTLMSN